MENQVKTLLQVVSLAACVGGLPASSLFAERPMGNRNDAKDVTLPLVISKSLLLTPRQATLEVTGMIAKVKVNIALQ